MTDACVFRLIEDGRLAITAVVHVDSTFTVGQKKKCEKLCVDLNRTIPVKNLWELKWYFSIGVGVCYMCQVLPMCSGLPM